VDIPAIRFKTQRIFKVGERLGAGGGGDFGDDRWHLVSPVALKVTPFSAAAAKRGSGANAILR